MVGHEVRFLELHLTKVTAVSTLVGFNVEPDT